MKLLTCVMFCNLATLWVPALAQEAPNGLTVVGHDGTLVLQELGGDGAPAPIVLLNGEILIQGDVDCGQALHHPRCRTLAWLGGAANAGPPGVIIAQAGSGATLLTGTFPNSYPPPLVVVAWRWPNNWGVCLINSAPPGADCPFWPEGQSLIDVAGDFVLYGNGAEDPQGPPLGLEVVPSGGVTLYPDIGPSTYPPPAVIVDGEWVNRGIPQNSLQAIGPNGDLLAFQGGQGESQMPIVLLGDEVLHPGGVDCDLDPGHAQCRALDYVYQHEGAGVREAPGVIIVNPGSATTLLDVAFSNYPPPLVVVHGVVVNHKH